MASGQSRQEQFLKTFLGNEEDLRAYARALLPTMEAVDEAIQEASLVMWRKLDQLRDDSEFLPWAKVIVRFECQKARRTFARDRHCFSEDVFELLAGEESLEVETDLEHERSALDRCLGKMDTSQRDLVLLPYRGHGAVADRAEAVGRSANTLYKKIRRLREKLTDCVEQQLASPERSWESR